MTQAPGQFLGLISGTSADGIDCVTAEVGKNIFQQTSHLTVPYSHDLRQSIIEICTPSSSPEIDAMGVLDIEIGHAFADAALQCLERAEIDPQHILAIGSHGQTIRHRPQASWPFTLQIGNPDIIALKTGIPTIAQFRAKDMALGGEGAPLVPAFHRHVFTHHTRRRIIINIGGIANVSVLDPIDGLIAGFDCGPGNTLLDQWIYKCKDLPYDENGQWASESTVNTTLLQQLLDDPYFELEGPRSTGREYFDLQWLSNRSKKFIEKCDPGEVQSTLLALTVESIVSSIQNFLSSTSEIFICGGGAHNDFMMQALKSRLAPVSVESTEILGMNPDCVEACAFAWLAYRRIHNLPGNEPRVTGASRHTVLGAIYTPE
ncbi:MAG: anhydro-N-acetylmuramic acid kinase [Pseudomonadota bacterium]